MPKRSTRSSSRSRPALGRRAQGSGSATTPGRKRATRRRVRLNRPSRLLLRLLGASIFLTVLFAAAGESIVAAVLAGQWAGQHRRMIAHYTFHYGIDPDLAAAIYHAALDEGIDPDLAYRLVRVESEFKPTAVSPAGALGLTQLMPGTADALRSGITREQILERDTNLHLGFRYLRWLLRVYKGDVDEALHAYNRGPGTVDRIRAAGGDPANGYADRITSRGPLLNPYRGNGLLPERLAPPGGEGVTR